MIWNHLLHAFLGYFARDLLTLSKNGLMICFSITAVVQGIDTIRFYFYSTKRLVTESPDAIKDGRLEAVKGDALYKLTQLWLFKVLWYGSVSMFIAFLFR